MTHSELEESPVKLFSKFHNAMIGHLGVNRMLSMLKDYNIHWDGMIHDIEQFIKNCPTCQKVRLGQGSITVAIRTTVRWEPYECIAIDKMDMPPDQEGHQYLYVIVDCMSRFVELEPAKEGTAEVAAKIYLKIAGRYGPPREIQSDQGPEFISKMIESLCSLCSKRHLTLPYRPQANGIVERGNKEVLRHLRAIIFDRKVKYKWSVYLPLVQRVMNSSYHSSIGTSPLRVFFGDAVTENRGLLTAWPVNQV